MTYSASAGTRMSLVTHFTVGTGAARRDDTRPSSSTGSRIVADTMSMGCEPSTKLTGRRSPRALAFM